MKRGLATGEHDLFDVHRIPRFSNDAGEELNRKEVCGTVIESVLVTKTVTAVQIADVC